MKAVSKTLAAFFISAGMATAQGVPVGDAQNTLQTIKQLQSMIEDAGIQSDQLTQLGEQVSKLQAQLDQLNQIQNRFSGLRDIVAMDMGDGLNGILNVNVKDIMGTFQSVAQGGFSGFDSKKSPEMKEAVEQAYASAGLKQSDVSSMASSGIPGAERTANQAASGAVLAAAAEQSYKDASVGLQRVDKIIKLAAESKDVKESIDMNTRMLGEIVVMLAKNLESTSLQSAYMGQSGVNLAATQAEERAYMTFSNE